MKKNRSTAIIYLCVSVVSLLILIASRAINDPSKYSWCDKHGWPEGIGNCFILGIEHFAIDALSMVSSGVFVAFIALAIVAYVKKTEN